jgi:flavin reductase (DIM6/NTAB) family NADH-FMN oxidoreductase RutF
MRSTLTLLSLLLLFTNCSVKDSKPEKVIISPDIKHKELAEPGPMIPPVPAIVLGLKGDSLREDILSVAWTFVLEGHPALVGISVTNKINEAGDPYYVETFLKEHLEFTLNVPDASWVEAFDDIDMSGYVWEDKFDKNNLTSIKSKLIDAPGIKQAAIILECKVVAYYELPPKRTVFFAEVVRVITHEDVTDENGRLISDSRDFFGMASGNGEFLTFGKNIGHIGMTKGREDIKY